MKTIDIQRTVPFGHCDPAGILYTPRAVDFCLEAIDEFWKRALGGSGWYEMNVDLDRGTPFVNLTVDFRSPITARAPLRVTVRLAKLGTSSVTFAVVAVQEDRLCFEATLTSVIVVTSKMAKIAPDDWLRQRLEDFIAGEVTDPAR
jgi:acyl-CoA thioesterase FadM